MSPHKRDEASKDAERSDLPDTEEEMLPKGAKPAGGDRPSGGNEPDSAGRHGRMAPEAAAGLGNEPGLEEEKE